MSATTPTLRGTILLIEEEPGARGLMSRSLKKAGATVDEVSSWNEALVALEKRPPDLLITGTRLTGTDGATIARRLKASPRTKGLPVLMLCPRASSEDVLACFEAGADDIVAKPFFVPELIARVRAHLRARRLYDVLARDKRDLDTLLEIHDAIANGGDPESVLESLVRILARVMGVRRASVVLASRDPRFGYAVAASDVPGLRNLEIDMRKYPEIARVMRTQKPLVVEDTSASSLFASLTQILADARVKSILAVPVVVGGEVVATLLLHARDTRRRFSHREVRLCSIAAQTAAYALRDSHLFKVRTGKGR